MAFTPAGAAKGVQKMNQGNALEIDASALRDIYFAGGCFWGVEEYFSRIPGVYDVTSGYANGSNENPTYRQVCSGTTGHAETVHVRYDPGAVSLKTLTEHFFKIIDPLSLNRQGNDVGTQYRTGVYFTRKEDKAVIQSVMDGVQKQYSRPLAVELLPLAAYYPAEEYHQDYLVKNPGGYCYINFDSLKDIPPNPPGETRAEKQETPAGASSATPGKRLWRPLQLLRPHRRKRLCPAPWKHRWSTPAHIPGRLMRN